MFKQYGCDDDTDDTAHVRTDGRGGFQALVGEHSLGIYPTFAEAMEAARESALSGEFDDTCDDCARAYGPHYGRCRCHD